MEKLKAEIAAFKTAYCAARKNDLRKGGIYNRERVVFMFIFNPNQLRKVAKEEEQFQNNINRWN